MNLMHFEKQYQQLFPLDCLMIGQIVFNAITLAALQRTSCKIYTSLKHGIIHPLALHFLALDVTMADTLRQACYSTHIVGKWNLRFYKKEGTPITRGFDTFFDN